jgi:hypothetical protein
LLKVNDEFFYSFLSSYFRLTNLKLIILTKIFVNTVIIMAFFFIEFTKLNEVQTKGYSMLQKEFRKGRIAC